MAASTPDRLERFRRRYAELVPGWASATAEYQRWVAAHTVGETRVLDLGCGRGGVVERLGRRGHWTGTDPDLASLREHRVPALARCCADSERLPFPTAHFDLVIASWVLEHLPDPRAAFREISRVLRSGGRFVFLTPNARHPLPRLSRAIASLGQMQKRLVPALYGRGAADTFPVAYQANTHEEIERLAVSAGLRLVRLSWVADPSYLAWRDKTFWIAVGFSALLPTTWKVHLVGEFTRT